MGRPRLAAQVSAAILCFASTVCDATDNAAETVAFSDYTPLASNTLLAQRLLSPLTSKHVLEQLAATGKTLAEQSIDLRREEFRVYVPRVEPLAGYGTLVFIPPWEDARLPPGWAAVLEKRGIIFVSAAKSGNAASPMGRREPLALLAAYNISRRYHVDPRRSYVGGFSGGARVALRLAMGYPDVFDGAFLDAGSDPVGTTDLPLPSRQLFDRLRTSFRFVYVAGERDPVNDLQQGGSVASLKHWCVVNVASESMINMGHAVAPASSLATALADLDKETHAPSARELQCWMQLTAAVDADLARAEAALNQHDPTAARALLETIDRRYGGLAAPRIVDLSRLLSGASTH